MVILSINGKWTNKSVINVLFIGINKAEFIKIISIDVRLLVKRVTACLVALHDTKHLDILREETGRKKAVDSQL